MGLNIPLAILVPAGDSKAVIIGHRPNPIRTPVKAAQIRKLHYHRQVGRC